MGLGVYLFGLAYYFAVVSSFTSQAPGFTNKGPMQTSPDFVRLSFWQWSGIALIIYASIHQHRAAIILAGLRHTGSNYGLPKGDWFEYVSCPHYLSECLIYAGFAFLLGHVSAWLTLTSVLINQIALAQISHEWYQKKFNDYPTKRKAIIPFLL